MTGPKHPITLPQQALNAAFLRAAKNGDIHCLLKTLALGADPLFQTTLAFNALHFAASRGYSDCVSILIPHCDALSTNASGYTPLHYAALYGHSDCLSLLLPVSDWTLSDTDGFTAFDVARRFGHPECAQLIQSFVAAQNEHSSLEHYTPPPFHSSCNKSRLL